MKPSISLLVRLAPILFGALFVLVSPVGATGQAEITKMYHAGRKAFYEGDMETAQLMLLQVQAANPTHVPTRSLLAQIDQKKRQNPGVVLKTKLAAVKVPKVDFRDAPLRESLDVLSEIVAKQTGNVIRPSFVLKGIPDDSKLTLSMNNIPATDLIGYMADLTRSRVTYEKHAIVLTPLAKVSGSSTKTAQPETAKPEPAEADKTPVAK